MNFLKKQPPILQVLLLSVLFFIGAIAVFAVQFLIEGRPEDFLREDSPLISCLGASSFFVILLATNKLKDEKFKFYVLFYFLWIGLLYFVFLYYNYGSDWAEHLITYTILFVLIIVAGYPHNIIFFTLSFSLLYLFQKANNTKNIKNPFA